MEPQRLWELITEILEYPPWPCILEVQRGGRALPCFEEALFCPLWSLSVLPRLLQHPPFLRDLRALRITWSLRGPSMLFP